MTYASGYRSSANRTNAAAISKSLSVFRSRKRSVRPTCEPPSYQARTAVETPTGFTGKEPFEEMFVASRPKFLAIAHSILRNREDAEDAVQDAFLSGYLHLEGFEGRSALKTWFTRIVVNAALMTQRRRKPSTIQLLEDGNSHEVNWTDNIAAPEPDPERIHAERETFECINGILGKMKPALRQAFTMTCYDELSGPEACAALGVSTGTFKARLFRARRQLLTRAKRALVAPIHKTVLSAPEFSKGK